MPKILSETTRDGVVPAVRLICWNAAEAERKAARLRAAGYEVVGGPVDPSGLRAMRQDPPAAVVIDLSRLPCPAAGENLFRPRASKEREGSL